MRPPEFLLIPLEFIPVFSLLQFPPRNSRVRGPCPFEHGSLPCLCCSRRTRRGLSYDGGGALPAPPVKLVMLSTLKWSIPPSSLNPYLALPPDLRDPPIPGQTGDPPSPLLRRTNSLYLSPPAKIGEQNNVHPRSNFEQAKRCSSREYVYPPQDPSSACFKTQLALLSPFTEAAPSLQLY